MILPEHLQAKALFFPSFVVVYIAAFLPCPSVDAPLNPATQKIIIKESNRHNSCLIGSSRPKVLYKKSARKNLCKFTAKHLWWSPLKIDSIADFFLWNMQHFSCEIQNFEQLQIFPMGFINHQIECLKQTVLNKSHHFIFLKAVLHKFCLFHSWTLCHR